MNTYCMGAFFCTHMAHMYDNGTEGTASVDLVERKDVHLFDRMLHWMRELSAEFYIHSRKGEVMEERCLEAYQSRIRELEDEVAYYRQENARLLSENEVLHETAWDLIRQLREIKNKKAAENEKKD